FAILSHENTKVFLSHSGVGRFYKSAYTATSMLILPIAYDQDGSTERLELVGIALKLSNLDLIVDDVILKSYNINEQKF
ncbi:27947_t:CDS:1, partial [Gigaspora margarita]